MTHNRTLSLNNKSASGDCVVYCMSRDQRVEDNHALVEAQKLSIKLRVPLHVLFCLDTSVGYRAYEHYKFMIDGLKSVEKDLHEINISFKLLIGRKDKELIKYIKSNNVGAVFFDFSPLKSPRNIQKIVANKINVAAFCVDTHNIIPLWDLSDSLEFAAHTIRFKVHKKLAYWLVEPESLITHPYGELDEYGIDWMVVEKHIEAVKKNGSNIRVKSGSLAARNQLSEFINHKLEAYATNRNDPNTEAVSGLSPYLHFGQISSLRVALDLLKCTDGTPLLFLEPKLAKHTDKLSKIDGLNALYEEMIVRKELADNFCFYSRSYKSLDGAWDWAQKTLNDHAKDTRDHIYSMQDLEFAKTHDKVWNACQIQMMKTGIMHGYMRMYWAKKILEWSVSAEEAIKKCVYLNDHYSLDGGDPNGYTGIMWSIAGVHDRPWFERPVFGKIRYMNESGLNRKFDVNKYINHVNTL